MSWQNRADLSVAQGSLTNSKRPSTFIEGVYPTHASSAYGCKITAGKKVYIDFICGLGTNLIGYGHQTIAEAIARQYRRGATISLSTELEVEFAETLKGFFACGERWKFLKTGTEACNAAIKIARAFTGRDLVLSDDYHGHGDDFISMSPPALGVPKRDWMAKIDFDRIEHAAAVILEPVVTDHSRERKEYLLALREKCSKHGTVLIFDEIITAFRFPGYSVAKYFGVDPDIILLGKALGAGMPLSAVGGRKDIMNCGEYFISGTFFGETVSMEAARAFLRLMHRDGTKYPIEDLWASGQRFLDSFNEITPHLKIKGYPTRGVFEGDELFKALFWQEACKAGILFGPSWFFNFPLMGETDFVLKVCRDISLRIESNDIRLEGKMPRKPFAQQVRSQNA